MNPNPNDMTLDELFELQKSIDENLLKQKDKVIQDIIGKMRVMRITIPDLQEHLTPVSDKSKRKPKYRNPENPDDTWTGNGRKPKWLDDQIKVGNKLEDFLIPTV